MNISPVGIGMLQGCGWTAGTRVGMAEMPRGELRKGDTER